MDKFCKLLEKILKARENDSQISDDEDDNSYRRKEVEKDLKRVTIGIEKKKSVEMLSEKQRIKRGKVSHFVFLSDTNAHIQHSHVIL